MALASQCVRFDLDSHEIRECPFEALPSELADERGKTVYWIHLNSFNVEELAQKNAGLPLPDDLIHHLRKPDSLPEVIETEDSLTISFHYWRPSAEGEEPMAPRRIVLHLTNRYCLTLASESIPALERFATTYRREFRFAKTSGFILFLIMDYLVDDYIKMRHPLDHVSEVIDDRIQSHFSEQLNRRILHLKRQIITFKNHVAALTDILMQISGRHIPVISESCEQSLEELCLHAQSLLNRIESLRELTNNSLEAYNAVLAQKMNGHMKVLTLFSAIILPMSLIASVYGMNFQIMPELNWRYGYLFALGLMVLCGVGLMLLFKKKKWF